MISGDPIDRLYDIRLLDSEQTLDEFTQLADDLYGRTDEESLRRLLLVFTDRTSHHEVMHSLEALVETFPADVYVRGYLQELPNIIGDARGWAQSMMRGILEGTPHGTVLENEIPNLSSSSKQALALVLDDVARLEGPPASDARRLLAQLQPGKS